MRKIYMIVTLAIALGALAGCNKKDGNDATVLGKLTYDGNVKSIRTAVFSVESEENIDFYTFGFFDTSSMPSESNTTASGLYIDLSSNLFGKSIDITKTVTGETYWDYDVSPGFEGEEIFNAYSYQYPDEQLDEDLTAVKSGTLKVTKDGIIFTVELSAVTLDDKQVNFYYKGKPVVSNYE